ncbi:hypothetical protein AGIG_G17532 [Arapaima gigas]
MLLRPISPRKVIRSINRSKSLRHHEDPVWVVKIPFWGGCTLKRYHVDPLKVDKEAASSACVLKMDTVNGSREVQVGSAVLQYLHFNHLKLQASFETEDGAICFQLQLRQICCIARSLIPLAGSSSVAISDSSRDESCNRLSKLRYGVIYFDSE